MAERNPPTSIQAGSHSSENDRLTLGGLSTVQGVLGSADLKVTAPGGLFIRVAAGWATIEGTNQAAQGKYQVYNDANEDIAVPTPDATLDRIDIVWAKVVDAAYVGGGVNEWSLGITTGTPDASPVAPSAPANSIVLAEVAVDAAVAAINSGNITDKRPYSAAHGSVVTGLSTDTISATRPGLIRFDTDTEKLLARNGADSAWVEIEDLGAWDTYTPTWAASVVGSFAVGNAVRFGRYRRRGRTWEVVAGVIIGSTTVLTGSGGWTLTLPSGLAVQAPGSGVANKVPCRTLIDDAGTLGHASGYVQSGIFVPQTQAVPANFFGVATPITWVNGDAFICHAAGVEAAA